MIETYCNQTAILKKKTGVDKWNKAAYAPPVSISCRFAVKPKLLRQTQQEQIVSQITLWTAVPVALGDAMTVNGVELPVLQVNEVPDLGGQVTHYKVFL